VRRLVAQDTDGAPAAPTLMLALAAMASLVVLAPRAAVGGVTHHAGARRVIVWAARKESAALRPTSMTSGSNIVILRLPR
jgi:hypothetical protein